MEKLKGWRNLVMMNECVPKYFHLDIPVKASQAQKKLKKTITDSSDEALALTEREKEYLEDKRERCFQLILWEDKTPQDTARMFTKHGDVSVVKTASG